MTDPMPTDFRALCAELHAEELDEFAIYWWGPETDERSVSDVIECGSMAAYARAVLARWGRPAIEPVPKREGEQ